MKNLKFIKVPFAGARVLSRSQARKVTGSGGSGQCGFYPLCLNSLNCVAQSGPCQGLPGTCGTTETTQTCTCAVIC